MRQGLLIALATMAIATSSCKDEEVKAQDVNTRSSAILESTITNSVTGITALQNATTLSALSTAMDEMSSAFNTSTVLPRVLGSDSKGLLAKIRQSPAGKALTTTQEDNSARAMSDYLAAKVFTADNLESSDAESATFLMKGEAFCKSDACTVSACDITVNATCVPTLNCDATVDQECVNTFTQMQLRIKATLVGDDGVDFDIMVGPRHISPLHLEARPNSVAVEVDLGATKDAYTFLAPIVGADSTAMASVMEGVIRAELRVNGEQDVTLLASILEAVHVEVEETQGTVGVTWGAADPVFLVHVQGLTETVTFEVNAAAFDMFAPYALVTENDASIGTFKVHVDGASASAVLNPSNDVLTITNIGLGNAASTVKLDDTTLFSLNLNADSGRRLALEVAPSGDTVTLKVTPELNLELGLNLASVAADLTDVPDYARNETLGIELSGSGDASVLPIAANDTGFPGGLKVTTGALTLTAASDGSIIVVPAGQCLIGDDLTADEHLLLGYFAVSACP